VTPATNQSYHNSGDLLPVHQSTYRTHHSTETFVLRVYFDLIEQSNVGNISLLALLDLSAAFDTVNYDIFLCTDLNTTSDYNSLWFRSNRLQAVSQV